LRLNFVFGREFVELAQGTKSSPAYRSPDAQVRWRRGMAPFAGVFSRA
jgi:hypothetical protein